MQGPKANYKTLGKVSVNLLTRLQNEGKTIFSFEDAMKVSQKDYFATGDFLSELVKRNILARIKSGKYLILQAGAENTQLKNWPVIARELVLPHPYFISHYSAMRLHGMTTHPFFEVCLTVPHRFTDKKVSDFKYHFIYCKQEHFWGSETRWVTRQEKVQVSDLERTILDGLDRPDLCGGILEVVRGIWTKKADINSQKLMKYAKKFRTKAAVKRLGLILETVKIEEDFSGELFEMLEDSQDYILLDPASSKEGKHLKRWHVILNSNLEELKEGVWA